MQLGLKLWSTNGDVLGQAESLIAKGTFQYVELMVVPGTDPVPFQKSGLPYVLHAAHDTWGPNPADPERLEVTRKSLEDARAWADLLGARFIVFHPGFCKPGFSAMENVLEFLKDEPADKRIVIENMASFGLDYGQVVEHVGYTKEQLELLMQDKFNFCLDLYHAMRAARSLGRNPKEYFDELLSLKPVLFHISDGDFSQTLDNHLGLKAGEFDLAFFAECIRSVPQALVTLETPREHLHSLKEDEGNAVIFRSLFS